MVNIEEFFNDIRNAVQHDVAYEDRYFSAGVFLEKMIDEYIEEQGLVVSPNLLSFQKQGKGKCDGYYYNELKNEITLFIVDYSIDHQIERLTNTDIDKLKKMVIQFYENSCDYRFLRGIDESHDGYEMAQFINGYKHQFLSLKILIVTNKELSRSVKEVKETEHSLPINISYDLWDLTRFYQLFTSQGSSEGIEISLNELGSPIPALLASNIGSIKSYLCVIPGNVLADLYDKFGAKLLESNVRSFLQFRANINKGIRKTIQTSPEKFFAYNNGLTATADHIEFDKNGFIINLKNLQIVNGGQTTVSLYQTRRNNKFDLDKISVQMKLNWIQDVSVEDEIVTSISRYANSQNKVNDSDFFSNHPFHRRFEQQSLRVWAPVKAGELKQTRWFYERARGSYLNAQANFTAAKKSAFQSEHPKSQLITKTDLAKLYLIFKGRPYDAVKGAEIAFRGFSDIIVKQWVDQEDVFNDEFFRQIISQLIILQATRAIVYKNKNFLGNTKAIISAYTVSIFMELLKDKYLEPDYQLIWAEQIITEKINSELIKLSGYIYKFLDIQALSLNIALLSYSKSKKAYDELTVHCLKEYKLNPIVQKIMKKRFSQEQVVKDERQVQKIDNELELLQILMGLGEAKWKEVIEKSSQNKWLDHNELDIIEMIPRYMAGNIKKTPTLKQLVKIESILMNLEDYSYYVFEG